LIEVCSSPAHLDYHDLKAVDQAARMIESLGIEAYSLHAPFAEEIDITSLDERRRDHARAELLRATEAAGRLGVRYLVIHPLHGARRARRYLRDISSRLRQYR